MEEDDQYCSFRCGVWTRPTHCFETSWIREINPSSLEDSLFPLLREVDMGTDPYEVFQDVEWALLIGAKPRGPGMERLHCPCSGESLQHQCFDLSLKCSKHSSKELPCPNELALKAGVFYDKVSNMTIWGKSLHDSEVNQVPNFLNARINGRPVKEVITDHKWLEEGFTESVQKRGGLLIQKWGRSSAASTAVSIVDAIKSLVYTNGNPYGIAEDLVFSMPCRSKRDGDYELVKDVELDDYLRNRIAKSEAELLAEKKCVAHLTGDGISFCDLGPVDTMLPGEV
ncbi:hypothetical protein Bca4012_025366 [Brassica carinata]